jgi:hypothetical protein
MIKTIDRFCYRLAILLAIVFGLYFAIFFFSAFTGLDLHHALGGQRAAF